MRASISARAIVNSELEGGAPEDIGYTVDRCGRMKCARLRVGLVGAVDAILDPFEYALIAPDLESIAVSVDLPFDVSSS